MKTLFNLLKAMFILQMSMSEGEGGGFMGGNSTNVEGGSNEPPAEEGNFAAKGGNADTDVQYSYPQGLDESYHGSPTLMKYVDKETGKFNDAEVYKALVHAQSAIGSEKIPVPNKNFTEEQWRETFHKLGLPEKIDEYSLENNLPEGVQANEEMFNGFKELAHKVGILPKQAQEILNFYNEQMAGTTQQQSQRVEEKIQQGRQKLEQEWGNDFETNMKRAEMALDHFFPSPEQKQAIAATGFLDTVEGTKFFAQLANGLKEDQFTSDASSGFGMDKNELQEQVNKTYTKLREMGKTHPQYQGTLTKYQNLLAKLHGNKPVGSTTAARV